MPTGFLACLSRYAALIAALELRETDERIAAFTRDRKCLTYLVSHHAAADRHHRAPAGHGCSGDPGTGPVRGQPRRRLHPVQHGAQRPGTFGTGAGTRRRGRRAQPADQEVSNDRGCAVLRLDQQPCDDEPGVEVVVSTVRSPQRAMDRCTQRLPWPAGIPDAVRWSGRPNRGDKPIPWTSSFGQCDRIYRVGVGGATPRRQPRTPRGRRHPPPSDSGTAPMQHLWLTAGPGITPNRCALRLPVYAPVFGSPESALLFVLGLTESRVMGLRPVAADAHPHPAPAWRSDRSSVFDHHGALVAGDREAGGVLNTCSRCVTRSVPGIGNWLTVPLMVFTQCSW